VDITSEGSNDSVVCRADGGGMSRDVFPRRIRVTIIAMIRLCAKAEIGVPRGAAFSLLVWNGLLPAFVINNEISFRDAYFSSNYLRLIWAPYQNALA
jgi:hypothetical protein